jgi:hypothetical protein
MISPSRFTRPWTVAIKTLHLILAANKFAGYMPKDIDLGLLPAAQNRLSESKTRLNEDFKSHLWK